MSDHKSSINNLAPMHIIWPFLDRFEMNRTALLTPKILRANWSNRNVSDTKAFRWSRELILLPIYCANLFEKVKLCWFSLYLYTECIFRIVQIIIINGLGRPMKKHNCIYWFLSWLAKNELAGFREVIGWASFDSVSLSCDSAPLAGTELGTDVQCAEVTLGYCYEIAIL